MTEILLSIIIPVYNVEQYLKQCLDSVFNQGLDCYEVICVNDGSTDGSREILAQYKQIYPELIIVDRENGGLSAARNSGLKMARGEYIYFLDSDDFLYPGVLSQMMGYTKKNDLDLCFFNVHKDGKELYFKIRFDIKDILPGIEMYKLFYARNRFFPPSAVWMYLYKRDLLHKNHLVFKEGLVHEDEEFTPRIYCYAKRTSFLDFPIQYHRVLRKGSLTAETVFEFKEKHVLDLIETCAGLYFFFQQKNNQEQAFYLNIFFIYFAVAKKIVLKKPAAKKRLFDEKDYEIMKKCAVSWEWYVYYWLFRYNTLMFKWYNNPDTPAMLKKILNKGFKIYYSLYLQQ
ncbi:glycosyltransferase [Thermodesulfobacteriota bacterium]